ncbi:hypothetical protein K435DRAFT_781165 [Dendrothele bispora CBS 962.96]|uniref:Uncharacterized protein n=1 Tax=Dendrothele bispora (strain CBS 962.96) TaxID=1314807 RepID=A0A4S8LMN1_DENBC|nr:hypothetical protein K435DRAFT_781165 [Dendrothele bispora CBS 962.96]
MPKPAPFTPKPAIEKLPLAVRKDVRDNFENEKEDLEKQVNDLLGNEYKFKFNPNEIWAYNESSGSTNCGSIMKNYATGFIYCLKYYVEKYGDEGKDHFNGAVSQSEISVGVNTLGDKAPTISCEVRDGVFWILFHPTSLGYNCDYIGDAMLAAIEAAPCEGLSLRAKHSVDEDYESKIDELQEELGKLIGMPDVTLDPNWDENFKALKEGVKDEGWQTSFGRAVFDYFEGFKSQLGYQGFKDDEMLQEGLADVFSSKKIVLRVLPKIKKSYNEAVIEDGTVYLQTTPSNWWVNVSQTGEGFIDLL